MENKCLNCQQEISDKAKYCSDRCRMAFTRKIVQPEQIQPEQPKQPEQKTPNIQPEQIDENAKRIGKVIPGYCHGCGREITTIKGLMTTDIFMPKDKALDVCICYHCVKAGITHESLNMPICD